MSRGYAPTAKEVREVKRRDAFEIYDRMKAMTREERAEEMDPEGWQALCRVIAEYNRYDRDKAKRNAARAERAHQKLVLDPAGERAKARKQKRKRRDAPTWEQIEARRRSNARYYQGNRENILEYRQVKKQDLAIHAADIEYMGHAQRAAMVKHQRQEIGLKRRLGNKPPRPFRKRVKRAPEPEPVIVPDPQREALRAEYDKLRAVNHLRRKAQGTQERFEELRTYFGDPLPRPRKPRPRVDRSLALRVSALEKRLWADGFYEHRDVNRLEPDLRAEYEWAREQEAQYDFLAAADLPGKVPGEGALEVGNG